MTRYLLDTSIISDATKPVPSEPLLSWLADQRDDDLFISALTIAEIRRGILEMPDGKKRRELEEWFEGAEGPRALFADRVLPFDLDAALVWAALTAEGRATGQPKSPTDMMIAAIAISNDLVVVTANERHFRDVVALTNPVQSV